MAIRSEVLQSFDAVIFLSKLTEWVISATALFFSAFFLGLSDPGMLLGKQWLLVGRQEAAEEISHADWVWYDSSDVKLLSFKVCKFL